VWLVGRHVYNKRTQLWLMVRHVDDKGPGCELWTVMWMTRAPSVTSGPSFG